MTEHEPAARDLKPCEQPLLRFLLKKVGVEIAVQQLQVRPMQDGGMGSLKIVGLHHERRKFGKVAAECKFFDVDGQEVSAVLNLDQTGNLFELDIFKSDFSPLLRWPTQQRLAQANREERETPLA